MMAGTADDLAMLLRESEHRCANDLQLVVGLLNRSANRYGDDELVREAFLELAGAVSVIAALRGDTLRSDGQTLAGALVALCEALRFHAMSRGLALDLSVDGAEPPLSTAQLRNLTLAVNELVTNALKHGFDGRAGGTIAVRIASRGRNVLISVDDDGALFSPSPNSRSGLELARRLVAAAGGVLTVPSDGSKLFVINLSTDQSPASSPPIAVTVANAASVAPAEIAAQTTCSPDAGVRFAEALFGPAAKERVLEAIRRAVARSDDQAVHELDRVFQLLELAAP